MKAFDFYKKQHFLYPEQMDKILQYLNEKGKLNISDKEVENYYFDFSDKRYSAGWMNVDTIIRIGTYEYSILEEFAEWLAEKEI